MAYEIGVGQTRRVLDLDGNPVPTANQPGFPYATDQVAMMTDDGSGNVVCTGNRVGAVSIGLHGNGQLVIHEITVVAAPFDWTLGDPV